jgi:glycosyltransferase involved in cell wall biosynthesis
MRILSVLTYYRPHTSGLTIYAERLAKSLVKRGHQVTIFTSQYDLSLPLEETIDGVKILRVPVAMRVNKGVIMPSFGWKVSRQVSEHDVVLIHLPQFDAAGVALRGRLMKKPTVILYHSDILLPPGLSNRLVNFVIDVMNNLAGLSAHKIVAYTEDFARHASYLRRHANKCLVILPSIQLPEASREAIGDFKEKHNPEGRKTIGMATRFAAEKGIEILLEALPVVQARYPAVKVLFAGQYEGVWGEEAYAARLKPLVAKFQAEDSWEYLGVLTMQQMAAFFPNLDVLVVPSLNSTETFGFVQVEAMMNGTPAVASNLPGVRQPVAMTGMGRVIPVGDAQALGEAILAILDHPEQYQGDPQKVIQMFHPDTNAAAFEKCFAELIKKINR